MPTQRFESLQERFGDQVGLVHGQMRGADKDRVMAQFASGAISVLVATTVVEVGVDVPQATVMVIENAERFGLAQLHQLRGRIGRGSGRLDLHSALPGAARRDGRERACASSAKPRTASASPRKTCKLRGEGEVLGTRQSGLPGYRIARPEVHDAAGRSRRATKR